MGWEDAILQCISKLGGVADNQDIYKHIGEFKSLGPDHLRPTIYGGRPAYVHEVRSCLSALVKKGALVRVKRGTHRIPPSGLAGSRDDGWPAQDPELRARVERVSVDVVVAHYRKGGFTVRSVEKENLGWDLNVTKNGRLSFRVEVKGRGGRGDVELTPNEYAAMRNKKDRVSYRLAVVRDALSLSPVLTLFAYDSDGWRSTDGAILSLTEKTGAVGHF